MEKYQNIVLGCNPSFGTPTKSGKKMVKVLSTFSKCGECSDCISRDTHKNEGVCQVLNDLVGLDKKCRC